MSDKIKNLFKVACEFGNILISYRRVGNPYSGPDWYKGVIDFSPLDSKEAEDFFGSLNAALEGNIAVDNNEVFDLFNDYFNFFNDKELQVSVYLRVKDNKITFYISFFANMNYWSNLDSIFCNTELTNIKREGSPINLWSYSDYSLSKVIGVAKKTLEILKLKWSIPLEDTLTEDMEFKTKALVMRRKFGTDQQGIKLMNNWLNDHKPNKHVPDVNY